MLLDNLIKLVELDLKPDGFLCFLICFSAFETLKAKISATKVNLRIFGEIGQFFNEFCYGHKIRIFVHQCAPFLFVAQII